MPPGVSVDIKGNADDLSKALGEATKQVSAFGKTLDTGIPTGKIDAVVDVTKKVVKVGKDAAKAGRDAAAAEEQFALGLAQVGISAEENQAAIDKQITASAKLAFTDDEARNSILTLSTATGDLDSAMALLTASQDIARLSGVSLETATDAVAKAVNGTDTALVRMIPGLEAGATGMDTINAASKLAAGQADAFSSSAEAMGIKTQIAVGEAGEAFGSLLLPALAEVGKALGPLLVAFAELAKSLLPIIIPLIEKLAKIAGMAAQAITKIVSAVTRLIDKIKELLGPLREAVDKLGQIDLNPFNGKSASVQSSAPVVSGLQTTSGGSHTKSGVTINIYGDPSVIEAKVTKALRDYARRNGVAAVFTPGRS